MRAIILKVVNSAFNITGGNTIFKKIGPAFWEELETLNKIETISATRLNMYSIYPILVSLRDK